MAVLRDPARPVESLTVQSGSEHRGSREALQLARERGIKVRLVDRATLDRLAGDVPHQGLALRTGLKPQPTWDDLLTRLEGAGSALLMLVDGVEDPRNLGAVLRSAEALGVMAVVVPKDRTAPLSVAAEKAAAGAAEHMDLVRVTNLARAMDDLRELGVTLYGLDGDGDKALWQGDFVGNVALVVGGEERGLRRLTRERCDQVLSIPLQGATPSLNLSVAAGIALYEVARQRGQPI